MHHNRTIIMSRVQFKITQHTKYKKRYILKRKVNIRQTQCDLDARSIINNDLDARSITNKF